MYKNLFIILILLLLLLLLLLLYYENHENNNNYKYLTKYELETILINNKDKYYNTFNKNDFKVRNITSINEYYNKIKNACSDITIEQQQILTNSINKINNKLINYKYIGFDGNKINSVPWIIGIISNKEYEEGFPHTRNNIIIIPLFLLNNFNLLTITLLHEKVHIYQKLFPKDIEEFIKYNKYTKYCLKSDIKNTRANPDLDEWRYKDENNNLITAIYINNPTSINDVEYSTLYEHPYEQMAYEIQKIVN